MLTWPLFEEPRDDTARSLQACLFALDHQLDHRVLHGAVPRRRRCRAVRVHAGPISSSRWRCTGLRSASASASATTGCTRTAGYKTSKAFEYFLALCGTLTLEGGPIFWVATHRVHHQHSDKDGDPHSPREGGFWAHMGWILFGDSHHNNTARDVEVRAGPRRGSVLPLAEHVSLRAADGARIHPARDRRLAAGVLGHLPAGRSSGCTPPGW